MTYEKTVFLITTITNKIVNYNDQTRQACLLIPAAVVFHPLLWLPCSSLSPQRMVEHTWRMKDNNDKPHTHNREQICHIISQNSYEANYSLSIYKAYPLLRDTGMQELCNASMKRNDPRLLPLGTKQYDASINN